MTMWNNVILCLGSNTDCEANLKSAVSLLRAYFGSIRFSEAIYTEPIGLSDSGLFLNQVAVAGTNASLEEVRRAAVSYKHLAPTTNRGGEGCVGAALI